VTWKQGRWVCPEGYGPACRNPLCRALYAIQARADAQHVRPARSPDEGCLNVPLARVLLERAQDGYVNPTGGKTTGRERKGG
jgi:hypothetical protein